MVPKYWRPALTGLCALLLFPAGGMGSEKPLGKAIQEDISRTMTVEKKVQKMKTLWSEEETQMADQLEEMGLEAGALEKQLEKLERRLALEKSRHAENLRQEKEAARVKSEIGSFLDATLERLEAAVASDLPFLEKERQGRLKALKDTMVDPDESAAEKFRRVFEALQIEAEYGTTVEVVQETIDLEGTPVLADVLRLGRISLFCQTIDQKKSGVFEPGVRTWKRLPEEANRDLAKAISMARLERSVEFVKLPLGRIVPQ